MRHDYATRIDGTEHTGRALIGLHIDDRTWQVAWVDTFHTGSEIMLSEGPLADDPGAPIAVVLVRHFNITPQGEEALAVETARNRGQSVERRGLTRPPWGALRARQVMARARTAASSSSGCGEASATARWIARVVAAADGPAPSIARWMPSKPKRPPVAVRRSETPFV